MCLSRQCKGYIGVPREKEGREEKLSLGDGATKIGDIGLRNEVGSFTKCLYDEAAADRTTENCARRGDGLEAEFAEP